MTDLGVRLLLAVNERDGMRDLLARELPGVPFAFLSETPPEKGGSVEAVLLGSVTRDAANWDPAGYPRLRFVQRIFAGVDDVPFGRLPAKVAVAGNVGGYAPFVSEHAVALALGSARCLAAGTAAIAAGRSRPAPELRSLWRETAVILGFGSIGRAIADRLRPFEARVVGVNRTGTPSDGADEMLAADRLVEALAKGRFIFDARPLTARTRGSLDSRALAAMPEDATFVNVGRGGTVDEAALYRHLQDHPRFRAALDVWWDEDFSRGAISTNYPFLSLPNFLGTPHWAGYAPGVGAYSLSTAVANLARFFRGEAPKFVVDRSEYEVRPAGAGS